MSPSTRIIVNTIAQFFKSILSVVFAFVATRYVLESLGVEDFGIYNLIAGIVSMLSFIMTAMSSSTQRFLSYSQGQGDIKALKSVFNNSLVLHLLIGFCIYICLEVSCSYVFDSLLNIDSNRLETAISIYHIILITLVITFATSPFRAAIIAHENIVFSSLIEILDSLLKLIIAFSLSFITYDLLYFYVLMLLLIQFLNFIVFSSYALIKYEECNLNFLTDISLRKLLALLSFTSWNIYNVGCVVGRMQGISILLNRAMGTTINAAYGLGFQISGAVNYLSASLANAINPQLMKAEGSGDRKRMLRFAELESKFAFLIFATISIPLMFEMQEVLDLWLKDVPDYSALFCRMVLLSAMADTLTIGLGPAIQAVGKIGWYTFIVFTIKLLTLPAAFIFLKYDMDLLWVAYSYIGFELLSSIARLPILRFYANLRIDHFLKNVFFKEIVPVLGIMFSSYFISFTMEHKYRFILTFCVSFLCSIILSYFLALSRDEKAFFKSLLKNKIK